ncbi:MAG: LVIVD repeat-containing protein [Candidatus Hodarchaeales archaeon]
MKRARKKLGFEKLIRYSTKTVMAILPLTLLFPVLLPSIAFTNITTPHRIGECQLNVGYNVIVENNYAYVTNNDGVAIIDVRNPNNPVKVSDINTVGCIGVFVENDMAFITSTEYGLLIANITVPESPLLVYEGDGIAITKVYVENNYAYVLDFYGGFKIFDVSDPSSPSERGRYTDNEGMGMEIEVKDQIAYIADIYMGLDIVDATNPDSPQKIATLDGTTRSRDVEIHDELIFLGCDNVGVKILDISNQQSPTIISEYSKEENDVFGASGDISNLFVADLQLGVYKLDITNLTNPVEVAHYSNAAPHGVFYDGRYVYIADQDDGFIILDFGATSSSNNSSDSSRSNGSSTSIAGYSYLSLFIGLFVVQLKLKKGNKKNK